MSMRDVSGLNWSRRGMCFVSQVARQMTSNMVVAKRDICKCVLLVSQWPTCMIASRDYCHDPLGSAHSHSPYKMYGK